MRVALCDNDTVMCGKIQSMLRPYQERFPNFDCDVYNTANGMAEISDNKIPYDFAILDVDSFGYGAIETAEELMQRNGSTLIFFMTGHSDYISDAFRLNAFQYLLKPISEAVLERELRRAFTEYRRRHSRYVIPWRNDRTFVDYSEILYIEVVGKHLIIHTEDREYECVGKIADEEKKLLPYDFVKCHQSYIVNLAHVKILKKDSIVLSNGEKIYLSRSMKKTVFDNFTEYLMRYAIS